MKENLTLAEKGDKLNELIKEFALLHKIDIVSISILKEEHTNEAIEVSHVNVNRGYLKGCLESIVILINRKIISIKDEKYT